MQNNCPWKVVQKGESCIHYIMNIHANVTSTLQTYGIADVKKAARHQQQL